MTEYDYSPEAYERFIATQRRISHWVDNTERHRAEFSIGNDITPPVLPTVYPDDPLRRRTASHDAPARPGHRKYGSSNYPAHGHIPHYATPPLIRHHPHPGLPGPMPTRHVVPPPPQVMLGSPPQSRESQKSRTSHRTSTTTYVVAPPAPPYYQFPYPYAQPGYPYMAPLVQGQPPVLPVPGHANGTPQNTPYYNPHPSQPLRVPPYPPAANINGLKQSQTGDVGGVGSLAYSYSTPLPFASQTDTPPFYGKGTAAAMHYLPPHVLHQRLDEIGRTHERRRHRSADSSYSEERGRSNSSGSGSRSGSHSRGRSRTRKPWWPFS